MREVIADKIPLPGDLTYGDMIITITGNRQVFVENYKGIIEYNENCVKIQGKHSILCICGKEFYIKYFTNVDMKIQGIIETIEYNS